MDTMDNSVTRSDHSMLNTYMNEVFKLAQADRDKTSSNYSRLIGMYEALILGLLKYPEDVEYVKDSILQMKNQLQDHG